MKSPRLAAFLVIPAVLAASPASEDAVAHEVLELVNSLRVEMKLPRLERNGTLDRVARERASRIASAPVDKRLSVPGSVARMVQEAGYRRYRKISHRTDLVYGYLRPGAAIVERWLDSPKAWDEVEDPRATKIGLASVTARDGTVVFLAILLQDEIPLDPVELEQDTIRRINDVREKHGLRRLTPSLDLTRVARRHSEDMAKRRYFAHETPEGLTVVDRARAGGVHYRTVAENISRIQGADDPVHHAVQGWMDSPGHRKNILDGDVVETGVGVTIDDDGAVYFTQLFLERAP